MITEFAKSLKTLEYLNQMKIVFKKFMIETALNTKLSKHLDNNKYQLRHISE